MVKKKCPNCNQDSFSAAVFGQWNCPYCKTDITRVPSNALELTSISFEVLPQPCVANKELIARKNSTWLTS